MPFIRERPSLVKIVPEIYIECFAVQKRDRASSVMILLSRMKSLSPLILWSV